MPVITEQYVLEQLQYMIWENSQYPHDVKILQIAYRSVEAFEKLRKALEVNIHNLEKASPVNETAIMQNKAFLKTIDNLYSTIGFTDLNSFE